MHFLINDVVSIVGICVFWESICVFYICEKKNFDILQNERD